MIFGDLISSFHLAENLEPLSHFFLAFKVIGEDGELLEAVVQVFDVDVQVVLGQHAHMKLVLRRDEQAHRVCNHLLGVAPVVFDSHGTVLLYPFQGGGAVHPVLAHEVLDGGKVLLAVHLLEGSLELCQQDVLELVRCLSAESKSMYINRIENTTLEYFRSMFGKWPNSKQNITSPAHSPLEAK